MISIEDVVIERRMLDGIYIKPCVGSGVCCTKSPCAYGNWNADKNACAHLLPPNEYGQRGCGRYDWIKENVEGWEYYPAFGAGCCMPMGNGLRNEIIKNLPEHIKTQIR